MHGVSGLDTASVAPPRKFPGTTSMSSGPDITSEHGAFAQLNSLGLDGMGSASGSGAFGLERSRNGASTADSLGMAPDRDGDGDGEVSGLYY